MFLNKLNSNHGETIVETLISVLIVAVCMIMIANSVVTAGKINKVSEDEIVPFNVTNQQKVNGCSITITRGTSNTNVDGKTCYQTEGGYYYYE